MQNENQGREPNWALANGCLMVAADTAAKLAVVTQYVQDIVAKRMGAALITDEIADCIERCAAEMVSEIRKAIAAKQGR